MPKFHLSFPLSIHVPGRPWGAAVTLHVASLRWLLTSSGDGRVSEALWHGIPNFGVPLLGSKQ